MANVEITGLPAVVTPATTDVLAVDQGGVTKKETVAQILSKNDSLTGRIVTSDSTTSTSKDTGSIVTEGGIGIEENLNVGGDTDLTGTLTVNDTTDSTTKDTGCVIVEGGVGVEKSIYTGDEIKAGKGIVPTGTIHDTSVTDNTIFDALSPSLPTNGNTIKITGTLINQVTGTYYFYNCSYAEKINATTIYIYSIYINATGGMGNLTHTITNGGSDTFVGVSISW